MEWLEAIASLPKGLAEPVLWLGDDMLLGLAAETFPEAEVLSSGAFKNAVFPREYSSVVPTEVRSHPAFLRAEQNALYSLQRYEDLGPIPYLKRRNYVSNVADYLYSSIRRTQPTHVIASEAPHTIHNLLSVGICDALGLPILHFQKCGLAPLSRPRLGMEYQEAGHLLPALDGDGISREAHCPTVPWMEMLRKRLEQCELPDYELTNSRSELRLRGLKGKLRRLLPAYYRLRLLGSLEDRYGLDGGPRLHKISRGDGTRRALLNLWRSFCVTRRHAKGLTECQRFLDDRAVDRVEGDAITFFLHYEPEMTSIPDAQFHGDQLGMVRALSVAAPPEFNIFVREHPSQTLFSTRGFLGRDLSFYEELSALPNVFLLTSKTPYIDIIKQSRMVATLTGTVAVEASLVGVPALVFGRAWYEGLRGCYQVRDLRLLEETISRSLDDVSTPIDLGELDQFLSRHFAEMVTVPSEWRRWSSLGWEPEGETVVIASIIEKFLSSV